MSIVGRATHANAAAGRLPDGLASWIRRACTGGQPLERGSRIPLGAALGHDLRAVRVHADEQAADLADRLQARAFAVGAHVFFARGAYDPDSAAGRALIAHEVAHVVQQCTGRVRAAHGALTVLPPRHPSELEADRIAALAAGAPPVPAAARDAAAPALRADLHATVVQRNVGRFVDAAQVDPFREENVHYQPRNCHEAVLGWLLKSMGYPRHWMLLRRAADRWHIHPNVEGHWMVQHVYKHLGQVTRSTVFRDVALGDVLCVGSTMFNPQHSMAVVGKGAGGLGGVREVLVRGFNNAGTFLHDDPQPPKNRYDPVERNAADPRHWTVQGDHGDLGKFGYAQGADLFVVKYQDAADGTAEMFPWEGAEIPSHDTPRWHYNFLQGWRFF